MREACYRCAEYIQHDGHCHGDLNCEYPMEPIIEIETDDYDPQWTARLILAAIIVAAMLVLYAI